jgi:hypothetical protein
LNDLKANLLQSNNVHDIDMSVINNGDNHDDTHTNITDVSLINQLNKIDNKNNFQLRWNTQRPLSSQS